MKILVSFANGIVAGALGTIALKIGVNSIFTVNGVGWLDQMLANPGWSIESEGRHLALWKPDELVPAGRRRRLLETIGGLCDALLPSDHRQPQRGLLLHYEFFGEHASTRGVFGAFIGGVVGFFVGGFSAMAGLMIGGPPRAFPFVFFGSILIGVAIGWLIGRATKSIGRQ